LKLRDIKIRAQLIIALGVILVLVVILGVVAWIQTGILWQQTADMYNHPLQVQRAISTLENDIMGMRLEFRTMLLAKDEPGRQTATQNSGVYQSDAERQFNILFQLYLGPRSDIENAHNSFIKWFSGQENSLALGLTGNIDTAFTNVANTGDVGILRDLLLTQIKQIDDFAVAKSDDLYKNSINTNKELTMYSNPESRNNTSHYWGWCRPTFDHQEFHAEKARYFSDFMSPGTYDIQYVIKTRLPGEFEVLPAKVEEMYYPEVFATTSGVNISIKRKVLE
jgi:hypothetical protein